METNTMQIYWKHRVRMLPRKMYALFAETTEKVAQLGQVPAYVLGIPEADVSTIDGAYEQGKQMKSATGKSRCAV